MVKANHALSNSAQNFNENGMASLAWSARTGTAFKEGQLWLDRFCGYVMPGPKCSIFVSTVIPGNFSTMAEIK